MSSDSLDVSEMYLSDDLNTPYKYTIESAPGVNTIIPPYGFIIIWADKMEPISELHTNFKSKNENESYLILSSKDGMRSDVLKYNKHNGDESIGIYPNGGGEVYIMTKPTINNKNFKTTYSKLLYKDETTTSLNKDVVSDSEKNVYYTIDGRQMNHPQRGINIVRKEKNLKAVKQLYR